MGGQELQEVPPDLLLAGRPVVAARGQVHVLGAEVDDLPPLVPDRRVDREAVDEGVRGRPEPFLAPPEPLLGHLAP